MRTMADARKFLAFRMGKEAVCRCPGALVLKSLRFVSGFVLSELSSALWYIAPRQLLYYPLTHPRSVTELSQAPPISSRTAGDAGVQFATRKTIGAPAMIRRMLQPPSPSLDMFPEFLKAATEQTVTTQHRESLFLQIEVRTTTWSCWVPRQSPDTSADAQCVKFTRHRRVLCAMNICNINNNSTNISSGGVEVQSVSKLYIFMKIFSIIKYKNKKELRHKPYI